MRLKPVLKIFSSDTNTALTGLVPSWGFSFSCKQGGDGGVTDKAECMNITRWLYFNTGCQFVWTRWPRGGNPRRERCPCAGPTLAGSCLCRRWGSWCRLCSSRRCRWGQCECCRSSPRPPHGPRSTGSPRYHSLRGETRNSFMDSVYQYTDQSRTPWNIPAHLCSYRGCNTCTHQHIVGGGVPAQDAHTFGVAFQLDNRFCEWRGQPTVRDLPNLFTNDKKHKVRQSHSETWRTAGWLLGDRCSYHDTAVLRAAGNDVVIVRTELDFQDRTCVAADSRVGHVDTSRLQTEEQ